MKLFMFYIGGNCRTSNVELHDVRFSVGAKPEDCYADLRRQWWGDPESLHLDSWGEVQQADGYDVSITQDPTPETGDKLFFVNLGGYDAAEFGELHKNLLIVAADAKAAKAKRSRTSTAGSCRIRTGSSRSRRPWHSRAVFIYLQLCTDRLTSQCYFAIAVTAARFWAVSCAAQRAVSRERIASFSTTPGLGLIWKPPEGDRLLLEYCGGEGCGCVVAHVPHLLLRTYNAGSAKMFPFGMRR